MIELLWAAQSKLSWAYSLSVGKITVDNFQFSLHPVYSQPILDYSKCTYHLFQLGEKYINWQKKRGKNRKSKERETYASKHEFVLFIYRQLCPFLFIFAIQSSTYTPCVFSNVYLNTFYLLFQVFPSCLERKRKRLKFLALPILNTGYTLDLITENKNSPDYLNNGIVCWQTQQIGQSLWWILHASHPSSLRL